MNFMHGIGMRAEVSEVKGVSEQNFSQRVLDKYDKILGDDELDETTEAEIEEQELAQEVFNPREDFEFAEFDFEDEGLKKVLDYFDESRWEGLGKEDKKAVTLVFTGYLTAKLDIREMPEVIYKKMPESFYGGYDYESNTMIINDKLLDNPNELADTIAHEMRHAYQHERAKIGETYQDALYEYNFENYVSAERDMDGNWLYINEYEDQLVEVEAREFAERITDVMEAKK